MKLIHLIAVVLLFPMNTGLAQNVKSNVGFSNPKDEQEQHNRLAEVRKINATSFSQLRSKDSANCSDVRLLSDSTRRGNK